MTAAAAPRAVIFDWDNTLVDTWPCIMRAINTTLAAMDRPTWTEAECRDRIGLSMRDSFPALFGDRWPEAKTVFFEAFAAIHIDMLATLPGAEDLLEDLNGRGVYLGVVSNKTGKFLRQEAEHLGWDRYFERLVGAGDAARDKPATDPVDMVLAGAGIAPGPDVWFVGDNLVDMQCAIASGCHGVLLRPDVPTPEEFPDCAPRLHFTGCEGLAAHLRKLTVPIATIR